MKICSALILIAIACSWARGGKIVQSETSRMLRLNGQIISIKPIPDSPNSRASSNFLEIKLKLELTNTSQTPIIFLNRDPLFVGAALAKQPEDFVSGKYLASTYVGPGVSLDPEWTALRLSLDKSTPPPNQTRVLRPNESLSLEANVGVFLPDHPEVFSPTRNVSLKEIKELSKVWVRVVCEVWPWNLEPGVDRSKLNYGRKLQRRWKNVGVLWLDEIYSEPIELNVSESKL